MEAKKMNWEEASSKIEFCEKELIKVENLISEVLPKPIAQYEPLIILRALDIVLGLTYEFDQANELQPPTIEEKEELAKNIEIMNNYIVSKYDWFYNTIEELQYTKKEPTFSEANNLIAYCLIVEELQLKLFRLTYYD